MSMKGHNSVKILRKSRGKNLKLDLVSVDVHTKFDRFCQFVLKILSRNEILMSIKGYNSLKIWQKMTGNNPKLDLVNVDWSDSVNRFSRY